MYRRWVGVGVGLCSVISMLFIAEVARIPPFESWGGFEGCVGCVVLGKGKLNVAGCMEMGIDGLLLWSIVH